MIRFPVEKTMTTKCKKINVKKYSHLLQLPQKLCFSWFRNL